MARSRPRVGIVGLGYVGSAVAAGFADVATIGFHDPGREGSVPLVELAGAEVVFVCVPTPARPDGGAELGAVERVIALLAAAGAQGTVLLKSTVPPRTTERLAGLHPALHLGVAPEFLRERSAAADFASPARHVLGWPASTPEVGRERVRALYRSRFPTVPVVELPSTEAELVKYAANAFFAVKVAFANDLAGLAGALGADWDHVREALALDPRIGGDHLRVPGHDGLPGFGGSCLPKDTAALLDLARREGLALDVLAAAVQGNRRRRGG